MSLLKTIPDNFESRIQQAKKGNISSSKFLLGKAAEILATGGTLPPCLLKWLTDGLVVIANTEGNKVNANRALNLDARPGRRQSQSEDMEEMIAGDIHNSRLGLHKADSAKTGKEGAYTKAAADYGISANTAETIYKKYQEGFLTNDELKRQDETYPNK